MFPLFLGIAAVALFSACSRREELPPNPEVGSSPNNNSQRSNVSSPQRSNAVPHREFTLSNPRDEYLNLCQVLFNSSEMARCNGIRPSNALQENSSQNQGLNAYYNGISAGEAGYSFAGAESRWGSALRSLQGSRYYLAGHGGCNLRTSEAERQRTCLDVSQLERIPQTFDFVDDYSNLLGTFFFLQANLNENKSNHCEMVIATVGSGSQPFCHMFSRHNIMLLPVSERLRRVDENVHLQGVSIRSVCQ